ncbi:MAG: DsrE family protein [Methanomicrobiaceae archaeon]|nr:DsrE family protein [Methanomicrobiaceae archaeon]
MQYRVLLHIDEFQKADLLLTNAENLLADLGESNLTLQLVANAAAVLLFVREPNHRAGAIRDLTQRGVRITACANAMKAYGMTEELLLEGVETVPSGIGEIARRCAEGFSYIRP